MKVSIYCLVYNHGKYLKSALEGFVNQKTNFDYQVIVHDDCSSDNSVDIIKQYAEKYPHIIKPIYQKENQYSKGVRIKETFIAPMIEGEYVGICEGDDYWCDNNKLQMQVDFLDNNLDYIACVHDTLQLNMDDNKTKRMFKYGKDKDISLENVIAGKCYHTSSLIYRKEMFFSNPPFYEEAKTFGDVPLAINLILNGKVRYIDKVMSVYRHGTIGSWSFRNECDLDARAKSYKYYVNMLKSVNEYSKYKYSNLLNKYIDIYDINRISFEKDYSNLKEKKYVDIFMKLSLRAKLVVIYRTVFRKLYIRKLNKKKRKYET